jgi:hypothetical protein
MELPLRVEVSRFSHIHFIQVLLPFVPGGVLSVGITLGNSWMTTQVGAAQIGYRTKLFLAVALTYLLGLAFLTATKLCTDVVMGLIRRPSKALPWENTYWRRVAMAYVGKDLLPANIHLSPEEITAALEYTVAMGRHEIELDLKSLTSTLDETDRMEKQLSPVQDDIDRARKVNPEKAKEVVDPLADQVEQFRKAFEKRKEAVADIRAKVEGLAIRGEWRSLHHALEFMPGDIENPYASFIYMMEAMQSAGLAGIWVVLRYSQLRTLTGLAFGAVLIIGATYGLWLAFKMNGSLRDMNSFQIAAMLAEIRKLPAEKT